MADSPKPLDDAMRWGFNHEAGYFEMWDMLGVRETVKRMKAEGYPPASWVDDMLRGGIESFYRYEGKNPVGVYDLTRAQITPVSRPGGLILLREQAVIAENAGATLRDLGDGIACLEFHTKMNALDGDIFEMALRGLDRAETEFEGLVVRNSQSDPAGSSENRPSRGSKIRTGHMHGSKHPSWNDESFRRR